MKKMPKYMTVGELIEQLQKYEEDKDIVMAYDDARGDAITAIDEDDMCVCLVSETKKGGNKNNDY